MGTSTRRQCPEEFMQGVQRQLEYRYMELNSIILPRHCEGGAAVMLSMRVGREGRSFGYRGSSWAEWERSYVQGATKGEADM